MLDTSEAARDAALAQIPRGDAWVPRDEVVGTPSLGTPPTAPAGHYGRILLSASGAEKRIKTSRELEEQRSRQWAEILRYAPRTAARLGIADQVRNGKLENHLGSGGFASAWLLPTGQVLKLTTDETDAFALWKIAQEGRPLPGLIDVFSVFRIELPFSLTTDRFGARSTVYGIITERVITASEYATQDANALRWAETRAAAQGMTEERAREGLKLVAEAQQAATQAAAETGRPSEEKLAKVAERQPRLKPILQMIQQGAEWCASHGINYWSDRETGNYGASVRDGKIVPITLDIGYFSSDRAAAKDTLQRGAPLARNRASRARGSHVRLSRRRQSNRRSSQGRTSSRRTSRGRYPR